MSAELSEAARALLDDTNVGVLTTLDATGAPRNTVVWVGRDGNDVLISSDAVRRKTRNLVADPRTSILVIDRTDPNRYVEVRGQVTVTPDTDRRLAQDLAIKYAGSDAADEYAALPPEVQRVVIRLTPDRILDHT
ncbi:PPOX class F420-dependent oxidoreductase [Kribbella sp. NPDC058245]|uniref:PPOX class F420-dependent oxidoreductase n=1 Tax=Kribbella sp. NPDC058245 TaxID=3346399 RepID=UPI0036E7BCFA